MKEKIIKKALHGLCDEIRKELNKEIDRVVENFNQSNCSIKYLRTTPLEWYSREYDYFVKEIFGKILGVHSKTDYTLYTYLGPQHEVCFEIGLTKIWLTLGKSLESIREEVIASIYNEYFRVFSQFHLEAEVLNENEVDKMGYIDSLIANGTVKEVVQVLSKDLYYDETFNNLLIINGYHIAVVEYLGTYKIPYISVEDYYGRLHEIPLYEPKSGNGTFRMKPRSRYDILTVLNYEHYVILNKQSKPSTKVLAQPEEVYNTIEYAGYTEAEVRVLFEMGKSSKNGISELRTRLFEKGYRDEDAFRIATCGLRARRWKEKNDLSVKNWYRFGCPILSEKGTYLPSLNHLSRTMEGGVSVIDSDWLIEHGPWIPEDKFEVSGVWKIPGILIGIGSDYEPIIYPVGLARRTNIQTMEELWEVIHKNVEDEDVA